MAKICNTMRDNSKPGPNDRVCGKVVLTITAADGDGVVLDQSHWCALCATDKATRDGLNYLDLTVPHIKEVTRG